jgi:GGDEF domain-containing protein
VPSGTWLVTATLPERNGECYYRIRHSGEVYERVVREAELTAIADRALYVAKESGRNCVCANGSST